MRPHSCFDLCCRLGPGGSVCALSCLRHGAWRIDNCAILRYLYLLEQALLAELLLQLMPRERTVVEGLQVHSNHPCGGERQAYPDYVLCRHYDRVADQESGSPCVDYCYVRPVLKKRLLDLRAEDGVPRDVEGPFACGAQREPGDRRHLATDLASTVPSAGPDELDVPPRSARVDGEYLCKPIAPNPRCVLRLAQDRHPLRQHFDRRRVPVIAVSVRDDHRVYPG